MLYPMRRLGGGLSIIDCMILGVGFGASQAAFAGEILWGGSQDDQWSRQANWIGQAVPTAADMAVFAEKGTTSNQVVIDQSVTVAGLVFNESTPNPFALESKEGALITLDSGSNQRDVVLQSKAPEKITIKAPLVVSNAAEAESVITSKCSIHFAEEAELVCETPLFFQMQDDAKCIVEAELVGDGSLIAIKDGAMLLIGKLSNTFTGVLQVGNDAELVLDKKSGGIAYEGQRLRLKPYAVVTWRGDDQIGDSTSIALDGGRLAIGIHTDQVGRLTLGRDSTITFSTEGGGMIAFKHSSSEEGWKGKKIVIENFDEGEDVLRFGQDDRGLTPAQVECIRFDGDTPAIIDAAGYVTPKP